MAPLPQTDEAPETSCCTDAELATRRDANVQVRECIPLVHHHVRGVLSRVPGHVDRDDLVSAGMYALATSWAKYDHSVGTTFAQFASARIRGALLDELRSMDWASRTARKRARAASATAARLSEQLGRLPSSTEVAADMGIRARELSIIEAEAQRADVISLQSLTLEAVDGVSIEESGPDADLLRREQLTELGAAIATLPPRLRTIVEQYFFAQRKMADIAAEMGVTESRVSQLRSQALAQLRQLMRAADDNTPPAPVQREDAARVIGPTPVRLAAVRITPSSATRPQRVTAAVND